MSDEPRPEWFCWSCGTLPPGTPVTIWRTPLGTIRNHRLAGDTEARHTVIPFAAARGAALDKIRSSTPQRGAHGP